MEPFEVAARCLLTRTLFIAMSERDHETLEYQKACGRAMVHPPVPPRHRVVMPKLERR